MVYHALYNIYRELYNPYGPRRVDIPHEVAVGAIRKLFAQLTDVGEASLPPSLVDDCRKRDGMFFAKILKRNSVALKFAAQSSRMSEARARPPGGRRGRVGRRQKYQSGSRRYATTAGRRAHSCRHATPHASMVICMHMHHT